MHDCWDATNCGIEKMCPAYPHQGRTCFVITGTLCRGERQGSYLEKISKCRATCSFYASVMEAEGVSVSSVESSLGTESNQPWQDNWKFLTLPSK